MNAPLLRNSLKLAVATLITAALVEHFDRIAYAWYPLLAVVIVVDDNDDHTLQAASGRILGTLVGCLLTFLVHGITDGWPGVLLSLLLIVPLLRLLGWQSALGSAGLIPIVFLMIPSHAALNWSYAVNRALDTAVGCAVAVAVGLLFWPSDGLNQLRATEERLLHLLQGQLGAYGHWLAGTGPPPAGPHQRRGGANGNAAAPGAGRSALARPEGRRVAAAGGPVAKPALALGAVGAVARRQRPAAARPRGPRPL